MKKTNKILLSLTPAAALVLPLAAISCGGGRFDQNYDGKLKVATGFSENNNQGIAMKSVIEAYNNWLKSGTAEEQKQRKEEGYLPTEVEFLPNGYSTGPLTTQLAAKEKNKFWNIFINYPTAASILATKEMNLAFPADEYEQLGIFKTFKDVNDGIGGNTEKKEKWVIPFSRSSEMSSIDMVVLGKLLKEIKAIDGVNVDSNSEKLKTINKYIALYEKEKSDDSKYVDEEWDKAKVTGTDLDNVKKAIKEMNITLSDDMFYEYDNLIKFSIAAKRLYAKDNGKYILAFDSLPSAINVMNYAVTKGNKSKQYINPSKEHLRTGGFDYESFVKEGTEQNKLFKNLLKNVFEDIRTGAVWIGGAGSYGSNLLTRHNLAISIGSTAGFYHTFIKNDLTIYYINDEKLEVERPSQLSKQTDKNIAFNIKSGSYTNKIFKAKVEEGTKIGKYDKQFASKEAEDKFNSLFKDGYDLLEAELKEKESKLTSKGNEIILSPEQLKKVFNVGNKVFANSSTNYVLIEKSLVQSKKIDSNKLLNRDEADWISAPLRKTHEDKKSVFVQGPSLVLIHANEKEDKATKLLVKWLFRHKHTELEIKNKKYNNLNSVDAFNQAGSYISPTDSYFDPNNAEVIKTLTPAEQLTFNNFKLVAENPGEYQVAEDVASSLSDKLRDAIRIGGSTMTTQVSTNKNPTFEQFLEEIQKAFK
ncbi:hypothetical protein DMC14_001325 [Metamycoplasma phocicerebrale]|uniref:P80 family lipoprotein n=1 Tax=Metamycoplasma phocicerebrale TaxID=142649 RepID=A0A3T0TTN4_9BACT|nr:P80 family lipoprotein [Metamycoplasma phocicerebrale]AZZ65430.2 hypothetical protein DMC14_001325 [Metamycoplasma phocicerebrale]